MQQQNTPVARDPATVLANIREISKTFALNRNERQRRRELHREDFDLLRDAGFLLCAVPEDKGGIYQDVRRSARPVCEMLRTLAHGDSSVALVASMHPAVIGFGGWLDIAEAPQPYTEAWTQQRDWVFQTACDGHWWGTIISEPGSGGDPSKSKATARRGATDEQYLISGQKHFGSGSGNSSFEITLAIPEGETDPDLFIMDMRDVPWDGSAGVKLAAAWDGHGMTATQSHAMIFEDMPAVRAAWPGAERTTRRLAAGRPLSHLFTAVVVGIVETAIETARAYLERKRDGMRPYERVEWSRVEMEGWLIEQAYEGVLRDVENGSNGPRSSLLCKVAVAELAETVLTRLSKVVGGSAYSRHSPYGYWQQDVRALGFLRPPWGFAFDNIFGGSWASGV
ncbi:MAG: acyl-CoA/acyl-ACP dehydrogenase [Chloroflexi bacterium]|nr:acyl-CoA/acyl-ACP dehydrogenase [Chloroflexota bacterium]